MSEQENNLITEQCNKLERLCIELRKYPIKTTQNETIGRQILSILYSGRLKDFFYNIKRKKWSGLISDELNELLDSAWAKAIFDPSKDKYGEPKSSSFMNCYFYIHGTIIDARMFAAWRNFYIKTIKTKENDFLMEFISSDEMSIFEDNLSDKIEKSNLDIFLKKKVKRLSKEMIEKIKYIDCSEKLEALQNSLWNEWKVFVSLLPEREKNLSIENYILFYYDNNIRSGYRKLQEEREKIQELANQQSSNTEELRDSAIREAIQEIDPDIILLLKEDNFRIYSSIFLNKLATISFQELGILYYSEIISGTKGVWNRTINTMLTRGYDPKDVKKSTLSPKFSGNEYLFKPILLKTSINNFELVINRLEDYLESNDNNNFTSNIRELLWRIRQESKQKKEDMHREILNFENNSVLKSKIRNFEHFAYSKSGLNPQKPGKKTGQSLFITSTKEKFRQIIKQTNNQEFLSDVNIATIYKFENLSDSVLPLTKIDLNTWQEFLREKLLFQKIESLNNQEIAVVIRMIIYYYLYILARLNLTEYILDIKSFIFK